MYLLERQKLFQLQGGECMDQKFIKKMQKITEEEQSYLDGKIEVKKDVYTKGKNFEIDRNLFLKEGKLVTVRPHSRFVEFPEHGHNYIEIMYVCQGSITHYIENNELIMKKGDILLMNPFVKHRVKRAEYKDIGINFIALPEFFDIPLHMFKENNVLAEFLVGTFRQKKPIPQYLLFQLEENSAIDNLMENIAESLFYERSDEDAINQYSMGLVFLYLLRHIESLAQESSQSYKEVVVQTTLKYIDTSYKNATLGKMADYFHQSLSVLSKLIRQSTGFTFQELLQRKRFHKAVIYLIETDLSVEEIAVAVGYENHSYFYRQFKLRYGMTPRQYRISHKNDKQIRI